MKENTFKRDYLDQRIAGMKEERQSFIAHYKDVSENILPRKGRFIHTDINQGSKKYQKIINSRGTQALKIARAGMLSGLMSPARPWFSLSAPTPELDEIQEVKIWLSKVEQIMRAIFNGSNLSIMAPRLIAELLLFGTGVMFHEDDFDDVARFYTHTGGSYMIDQNDKFEIDTFAREFQVTAYQAVNWWKYENCSTGIKTAWDRSQYSKWFPVVHIIERNPHADDRSKRSSAKPFRSIYFEPAHEDKDHFLSLKGFDEFPVYAPRWDTTDGDIYGTDCPAMTALGDIRGLQNMEKRKAQGIDKMVSPPLKGPAALKEAIIESVPSGFTASPGLNGEEKLESIYDVRLPIGEMRQDIDAVERRINEAFMVDMFLAISNMEGIQPKNELELSQRNQERLLQLGPMLEGFHRDFLRNLIDRTFNQAARAGILPPAPQQLEGKELKVEYISSLAAAQRSIATSGIERMAGFTQSLIAGGWESAADKFDADQAVDEYSKVIHLPPKIIVPDEVVKERRAQRQQQEQQEQQVALANEAASAAKNASQADLEGDNALSRVANAIGGGA